MDVRGKVLVTGAAGFIGSALCEHLASSGWVVMGLDNLNDYYSVELKLGRLKRLGVTINPLPDCSPVQSSKYRYLSFIKVDITDRKEMENIFRSFRPDQFINLAAQAGVRYSIENPYSYVKNNIEGFLVGLECARHWPVKKFIYASSSSVYGSDSEVPFKEDQPVDNPVSLYAATKKSNEVMARAYKNLYNIPVIGLRFFTVYGPWGRPDMAPMLFANAILKGEKIKIFNNGNLSRDFTYIDDIVNGITKIVDSDFYSSEEDIYNIGAGSPVSLMDFISELEDALGKEAIKEFLPMQKGDVYTTYSDTSRLSKNYDYRPSTKFNDGIKKFAEWYLAYFSNQK